MSGPYNPSARGTLVQSLPSEESWSKLWPYRVTIPASVNSPQPLDEIYQWLKANLGPDNHKVWDILPGSLPVINGQCRMIYLFKEQEHSVRFLLTWL